MLSLVGRRNFRNFKGLRGLAFLRDLSPPAGNASGRYQHNQQHQHAQQQVQQARFDDEPGVDGFEEQVPTVKKSPARATTIANSVFPIGALVFPEEANQNYDLYPTSNMEIAKPFDENIKSILSAPISDGDIEIKPDGPLYLPEVRYRRILLSAFGPGGWSLLPRGPHTLLPPNILTREYALYVRGQIVSIARGAAVIQGQANAATGSESVRSNALMRCCKDLGVASELWDPQFVLKWRERFAVRKSATDRYGNTKYLFTKRSSD